MRAIHNFYFRLDLDSKVQMNFENNFINIPLNSYGLNTIFIILPRTKYSIIHEKYSIKMVLLLQNFLLQSTKV